MATEFIHPVAHCGNCPFSRIGSLNTGLPNSIGGVINLGYRYCNLKCPDWKLTELPAKSMSAVIEAIVSASSEYCDPPDWCPLREGTVLVSLENKEETV